MPRLPMNDQKSLIDITLAFRCLCTRPFSSATLSSCKVACTSSLDAHILLPIQGTVCSLIALESTRRSPRLRQISYNSKIAVSPLHVPLVQTAGSSTYSLSLASSLHFLPSHGLWDRDCVHLFTKAITDAHDKEASLDPCADLR